MGDKASTVLERYMEEKHMFKWKLEAFVVTFASFRKKILCLQSYTRLGQGVSDLSWCVSLQLKLCWLIIWCRVTVFVLEICLLILIKNAVHLRGVTQVMRTCESTRGTRSQRGKARSGTKLLFS